MEAASKIPLLGGARSGTNQKRHAAVIGVLALLGVIAMLATINFQDEAGSGSVVKMDADAFAFADDEDEVEALKASTAAVSGGKSVTSMNVWTTAEANSNKASKLSRKLKKEVLHAEHKSVRIQKAAAKKTKGQKKARKHKVKSLKRKVLRKTKKAVQKAMASVMKGVGSKAVKAADKAAMAQVRAERVKQIQAEKAERKATLKEATLQHAVDGIRRYRDQIRRIQLQQKKDRVRAKAKAVVYAKKVTAKVSRAKVHFEQMRHLLAMYRAMVKKTKSEKKRVKRMAKTMNKLKHHLKKDAKSLTKVHKKLSKEKHVMRRSHKKFKKKKRRLKRRLKKLIKAMRESIKEEELVKNTPSKNGQLRLNQLNIRSQQLAIKISKMEADIRRLKKALKKSHKKIHKAAKKAHQRAAVLKVAHAAYSKLSKAVARLKEVARAHSTHIVKPKSSGVGFTKKILRDVKHVVKKAAKKGRKKSYKRFKKKVKKKL